MKLPQILLTLIFSFIVAFVTVKYITPKSNEFTPKESAYDRVLRTGVIRCGYADWPPYVFVKDPTTGKISGIFAEVAEAMANKLNLKIDWAENTGFGGAVESLRDQRIDIMCAGLFRNAQRGRYVSFLRPIFYSPVYAYVPIDEHRFDNDLLAVNQTGIRISTMDGEISDVIAKQNFPKATEVAIPQLGQITDILVNVSTHKADIVLNEPSFVDDYIKNNPNTLRRVSKEPFEVFETAFAVDMRETQLREMLNSALAELENQGVIDGIISKYNPDPKVFLHVAKPYQ